MIDQPFSQTPLFQLNLLIFLGWPSGPSFVRPIFRDAGFTLYFIGPAIPTSLQARTRAANASPPIPFMPSPSPDLVFRHDAQRTILPVECKLSSFGPNTEQARQAAALLSCTGPHLADVFGLSAAEAWSAFLLYAVRDGEERDMKATLLDLSAKLQSVLVDTAKAGSLGIRLYTDGVYLVPEHTTQLPVANLNDASGTGLRVLDLAEGEDPRPLYIIPLDPNWRVDDPYEKRALEERVRIGLVSLIGSQLDKTEFDITVEDLMRATIEVWDVWADRNAKAHVRNAVRAYARTVLQEIAKLGVEIIRNQDQVVFRRVTPAVATEVRRYLTSTPFRQGRIDLWSNVVQLDFGSLADGW